MFASEEVSLLKDTMDRDRELLSHNMMEMKDDSGGISKLCLWNEAGDNTYGMFARSHRWINASAKLIGQEVYHFHTKLMIKEPKVGGQWVWHQDFGYWYQACLSKTSR